MKRRVLIATLCLLAWTAFAGTAFASNIADGDVAGLIAAINAANTNPGADIINLAPGGTYTLTAEDSPGNGLPAITSQITINGNGAIIQRSSAASTDFRIFLITSATGDLTVNEVTI